MQDIKKADLCHVLRSRRSGEYVVKWFDVYGPLGMANIWGMDSVLESKCITIVLQKTRDPNVVRMPEWFIRDQRIRALKAYFEARLCT